MAAAIKIFISKLNVTYLLFFEIMKRHENLVPLSREHHKMLLLAQLLKKDAPLYKGMPETLAGKIEYANIMYHGLIKSHIRREEDILFKLVKQDNIALRLIQELEDEHQKIHALFNEISSNIVHDQQIVHNLAVLLVSHIRKEERQLFQMIQKEASPDLLKRINLVTIE